MKQPDMKSRLKNIDVARGIAILCIVIGHLGIGSINRVVFTFHVPVFYLISGYFLSEKSGIRPFVQKKINTLLVPYYLTCLCIIALGVLKGFHSSGISGALHAGKLWVYASLYAAGDTYKEPFYIKSIGAIWFLWAAFWGQCFLKLSLKMRPLVRIAFVAALFLVGYYSRRICWFPLSIQAGCCAVLWMYIGYLYRQAKPTLEELTTESKYAAILFAALVWAFFIRDFKAFWLVHCNVGRGIVDIFGSLCAAGVVIWISGKIAAVRFLGDGLAFLGRYSLYMLCFHIIELTFVPWQRILSPLYNSTLPGFLVTLILILLKYALLILLTYLASILVSLRPGSARRHC